MLNSTLNVSIVGASGYAGGELLRILLSHPNVDIGQVTSKRYAGQPITLVHPNLRGISDLRFCAIDELENCDLLFICLPNKKSMTMIDTFSELAEKIIDLGADYRLNDSEVFYKWYGIERENDEFSNKFVYGLAELNREKIKEADFVACGGCEATAVNLAFYPLVKEDLLIFDKQLIADVKIGSSASGNKGKSSTHHPERHGVLRSYKPTHHRHQAEIKQELGIDIEFSATAVNIVRGILATIHTTTKDGVEEKDVWKAYRRVYSNEPFIRIVKQRQGLYRYPEPKILWGTNYCDIGFEKSPDSDRLVVISAIDNLVKGTAGQAVQAMNIMYGFEETTGLSFTGLHPV